MTLHRLAGMTLHPFAERCGFFGILHRAVAAELKSRGESVRHARISLCAKNLLKMHPASLSPRSAGRQSAVSPSPGWASQMSAAIIDNSDRVKS